MELGGGIFEMLFQSYSRASVIALWKFNRAPGESLKAFVRGAIALGETTDYMLRWAKNKSMTVGGWKR